MHEKKSIFFADEGDKQIDPCWRRMLAEMCKAREAVGRRENHDKIRGDGGTPVVVGGSGACW